MADEEEMSRAEEVAKRAMELAARAEELARQAHEVSGVDEQLAALEAELDSLVAEEAALDDGMAESDEGPSTEYGDEFWPNWAAALGDRMQALGDRLGEVISGSVDAALSAPALGISSTRGRKGLLSEHDAELPIAGPVLVRIMSGGGTVEVVPGRADRVHVTARFWLRPQRPDDQPVHLQEQDGVVLVETARGHGWRSNVVHITVEVPLGSPVDASTGGGSVKVEGTHAPVRVRTGGGSVSVVDVEGELVATTGGGSIRIAGRISGESSIRTGGGSVEVNLDPHTRVELAAHGTPAMVDVPGLKTKGSHVTGSVNGGGEGRLEVTTGGGSVRIHQS